MKIKIDYPPNIRDILHVFPYARTPGVIFTYGDTLYNPSNRPISDALKAHEETHAAQQERVGVETWWNLYLESPQFRFDQELKAHGVEWRHILNNGANRNERRSQLTIIAKRLSGPLYGRMVTLDLARKMIDTEARHG